MCRDKVRRVYGTGGFKGTGGGTGGEGKAVTVESLDGPSDCLSMPQDIYAGGSRPERERSKFAIKDPPSRWRSSIESLRDPPTSEFPVEDRRCDCVSEGILNLARLLVFAGSP